MFSEVTHLFILRNALLIKVYYTPERCALIRHEAINYNIERNVGRRPDANRPKEDRDRFLFSKKGKLIELKAPVVPSAV